MVYDQTSNICNLRSAEVIFIEQILFRIHRMQQLHCLVLSRKSELFMAHIVTYPSGTSILLAKKYLLVLKVFRCGGFNQV